MNFEPQKFFIGLVDFFSVLMPGAMLAYAIKDWAAATLFGFNTHFPLNGTEAAVIFLFASYLLGHMLFLVGAILDETVYEPLRALTELGQMKRLTKGDDLRPHWLRWIASTSFLFGRNADNAAMQAQQLKARALHKLRAEDAINAFQWCKARLAKDHSEGLLAVQRFEADSKFFRSFFVVLATLAAVYALRRQGLAASLCLAAMAPVLWSYIDQRFKATQQAYRYVITLEAERMLDENKPNLPAAAPRDDGLSHAGGAVYRMKGEEAEYMMVGGSKNRSERLLPKGHIEPGEDPRITAVREVREESGHWARVECFLGDRRLDKKDDQSPLVRWFLLEHREGPDSKPRPENRPCEWLSLKEAVKRASFRETRVLLRYAERRRRAAAKARITHRT